MEAPYSPKTLIPMKLQAEVKNSLDVPANLISLCPNCHRRFHHAIDKENKSLIVEFYEKRKKALKKFAIDIGVDKLL